jgi:hypothetical protein
MLCDAEEVLLIKLENNILSIQVDESTDFTSKGHGIAFVRFINDSEIQENFLLQRAAQNRQRPRYI